MTTDPVVTSALQDLLRACETEEAAWALVGGQALISYGVPRDTSDVDGLIDIDLMGEVAMKLVEVFKWTPLRYDETVDDYVESSEVKIHYMSDPVLFDMGVEREMIPMKSSLGLLVELLAIQHPVEAEIVERAAFRNHQGTLVPIASLNGVLFLKTKAHRLKDVASIEQVTEHLKLTVLQDAIRWAEARDLGTAEDLKSIVSHVRIRLTPQRTSTYKSKKK